MEGYIFNLPFVLLGIGFLIFMHELGHFIMAKKNGVRVDVFSIGFGPAIWSKKKGVTEYRIAIIPLGGYVKLAGELPTPDRKPEPDELFGKSAWARVQIFAAGAVMNLIIAFPLCVAAELWGKYVGSPVVGRVAIPESYGGMMPGDRIIEVDGVKIASLEKYRIEMLRRPSNTEVPVTVLRHGEEKVLQIKVMNSKYHRVGVAENMVAGLKEGEQAAKLGFRVDDSIEEIRWKDAQGKAESRRILTVADYREVLMEIGDRDATFVVYGQGERREIPLKLPAKAHFTFPREERLMEPIVESVSGGSPAHEILQPDDRIRELAGQPIKSFHDLKQALKGRANQEIKVKVERQGKTEESTIRPISDPSGNGVLGIALKFTNVVADVEKDSYYWKLGLRPGHRIKQVGAKSGAVNVTDIFAAGEKSPTSEDDTRIVRVLEGEAITIAPQKVMIADHELLGLTLGSNVINLSYAEYSFGDRVLTGLKEPWEIVVLTFQILSKLVTLDESPRGLAGPVGIFDVSFKSIRLGFGNFIWVLGLITVNLGIINLLPLPLLDGGHMWILLIAEKIKGRPPSEKFLAVFQYVGLALFLFLVVFVTFNDISRLLGE